jgi:epoxyqueuosine reductase QueG
MPGGERMIRGKTIEGTAMRIERMIKSFINDAEENSLRNDANDRAWEEPLVGFSRGDDPLYERLKADIGRFVWTPLEIFSQTFPSVKVGANELSVISWILPQTEKTKSDNRNQKAYPSETWVRARVYGEEVNDRLREHVVETLRASGIEAVAPLLSPFYEAFETSDRYGFAATWSERHTAYVSGLGTFGLCDGLITPRGKAMRCGSVVGRIQIPATERPYDDPYAYCLFFTKGLCGECIDRCPTGAITEAGHDKERCHQYLRGEVVGYTTTHFDLGGDSYSCGLCQTGVACESKIPTEADLR